MSCVLLILGFDASNRLHLDDAVIRASMGLIDPLGPCKSPICTRSTAVIAGISPLPARAGQLEMLLTDDANAKPAEAYVLPFDTHENAVKFVNACLTAEKIKGKVVLIINADP